MVSNKNHCATKTGHRIDIAVRTRNIARRSVIVGMLLALPVASIATTSVHTEDGTFFPADVAEEFGFAVAAYGDTAVVGDPYNDLDGANAGAAWVFVRSGTAWVEQARLVPSDIAAGFVYGWAVDIYDDYIVVGAPWAMGAGAVKSGAAYVFKRDGTDWTEHAKLIGSAVIVGDPSDSPDYGDIFGTSVAINGDIPADATNNEIWHNIFVGAPGDLHHGWLHAGSTHGFQLSPDGSAWVPMDKVYSDSPYYYDEFGGSVDLDGDHLIVGAQKEDSGEGAAYVWVRRGMLGAWSLETRLTAGDPVVGGQFGAAVAVSATGGLATFVVGAPDNGVGPENGSAYVFVGSAATFPQFAKLTASDGPDVELFGTSVAVNNGGILVGAPYVRSTGGWLEGAVYAFSRDSATWLESERLIASSYNGFEQIGNAVAITGETALVGSDQADGSVSQGGAVLVFDDLDLSIFRDGFESASTSAWSTAVP